MKNGRHAINGLEKNGRHAINGLEKNCARKINFTKITKYELFFFSIGQTVNSISLAPTLTLTLNQYMHLRKSVKNSSCARLSRIVKNNLT